MSTSDKLLDNYYQGVPTLVTGGASFIGSALVELLVARGAKITVADNLSSGTLDNLRDVKDKICFLEGDLRDPGFAACAARNQQIVFHLAAAHGGRGYIDSHPVECTNNMLLDHIVFDAVTAAGALRIVYASSACVYPTNLQQDTIERILLRETDAGFDQAGRAFADGEYGWAKLMGELQLRAFHRQHGVDGIAARIFTAYGERENETHAVIALVAKALARYDPYPVWGDGTQTRNFTYVGDTVYGLALAGAHLSGFRAINLGTDRHHRINELIEEIFHLLGWHPDRLDYQLDRPVGVKSRASDNTKITRMLNWSPNTGLREGLRRTIQWYRPLATAERLANLESQLTRREVDPELTVTP
ncbi:NAD-dependent epimerase/dehydratase family protein [Candidatus Thiosymbion oneisti]|uniref:NAD-dependent epimerase/dehydratase family protein n=1 Tax=Candidatus Thiosymbion oneisti TaxID=589554 RepID=UPI000B7DA7EC|nr:NAD-dependent epimerase/dehydratase family protein [Candidatus Thiosymbion oneisti]